MPATELDGLRVSVEQRVEEPSWHGAKLDGKFLYISFHGPFSTEAGQHSAEWARQHMGDGDFGLIFDTREVAGYESGARKAWEDALFPERKRICEMVLLADSTVAVMGATLFGLMMGIKVRRIQTLSELEPAAI